MPSPCPKCGRQPKIEQCGPWPKGQGPAPWYVGCYDPGINEHFVGVNGYNKTGALLNWEREVVKQSLTTDVAATGK